MHCLWISIGHPLEGPGTIDVFEVRVRGRLPPTSASVCREKPAEAMEVSWDA